MTNALFLKKKDKCASGIITRARATFSGYSDFYDTARNLPVGGHRLLAHWLKNQRETCKTTDQNMVVLPLARNERRGGNAELTQLRDDACRWRRMIRAFYSCFVARFFS
jgi:hypothetical protein